MYKTNYDELKKDYVEHIFKKSRQVNPHSNQTSFDERDSSIFTHILRIVIQNCTFVIHYQKRRSNFIFFTATCWKELGQDTPVLLTVFFYIGRVVLTDILVVIG